MDGVGWGKLYAPVRHLLIIAFVVSSSSISLSEQSEDCVMTANEGDDVNVNVNGCGGGGGG